MIRHPLIRSSARRIGRLSGAPHQQQRAAALAGRSRIWLACRHDSVAGTGGREANGTELRRTRGLTAARVRASLSPRWRRASAVRTAAFRAAFDLCGRKAQEDRARVGRYMPRPRCFAKGRNRLWDVRSSEPARVGCRGRADSGDAALRRPRLSLCMPKREGAINMSVT